MKRLLKILFITAAVVICLAVGVSIAVYLLVGPQHLGPYVLQLLIAEARANKIVLSVGEASYDHAGAHFKTVDASFMLGRVPSFARIENLAVEFRPAALLDGSIAVTARGTLYGGSLSATAQYSLSSSRTRVSAELKDVMLGAHPQVALLGVRGGALSARTSDFVLDSSGNPRGTVNIRLENLSRPESSSVPFFPIKIPRLGYLHANGEARFEEDATAVPRLELSSSFGALRASAEMPPLPALVQRPPRGELTAFIDVHLSQEGVNLVGDYLPLLSSGKIERDADSVAVKIDGDVSRPRFEWRKIGD